MSCLKLYLDFFFFSLCLVRYCWVFGFTLFHPWSLANLLHLQEGGTFCQTLHLSKGTKTHVPNIQHYYHIIIIITTLSFNRRVLLVSFVVSADTSRGTVHVVYVLTVDYLLMASTRAECLRYGTNTASAVGQWATWQMWVSHQFLEQAAMTVLSSCWRSLSGFLTGSAVSEVLESPVCEALFCFCKELIFSEAAPTTVVCFCAIHKGKKSFLLLFSAGLSRYVETISLDSKFFLCTFCLS